MSTRSSSRLRSGAGVKAESLVSSTTNNHASLSAETEPSTRKRSRAAALVSAAASEESSVPTGTILPQRPTRSNRSGIVKTEDGELDALTMAKLKLEAEDHRKALAQEKAKPLLKKRSSTTTSAVSDGPRETKKSKFATKEPVGWEVTLDRLREFRLQHPAPVDTMGCERLAETGDHIPPEVSRFQTLMSLVLSSQTKDTVTSVAVRRLQRELKGGLTIQGVLDVPNEELNSIIGAVGFHNKKTIFMKQVAEICRTQYNGDIPDTAEGLIALPGVGPKMAYLTLQCAWNKNLGIGVDTHVHRISNRLGWIKTEKDGPEATREALQSWLPKEHWREINHILVGFGQVLCLPRGPLCSVCPVQERCPSATAPKQKRTKIVKEELVDTKGEVIIHPSHPESPVLQEVKTEMKTETIKQEESESPYFCLTGSHGDEDVMRVKDEDPSSSGSIQLLQTQDGHEVDTSNLEKEAADIEDLFP